MMRSRRFPSLVELLLPLLVAAVETAAIAPLVALIDSFLDDQDQFTAVFVPAMAAIGLIGFFSTRWMARAGIGLRLAKGLTIFGWLAVTLVWIESQHIGGLTNQDALPQLILIGVLSLLAWWRGLGYGSDPEPFLPERLTRVVQGSWAMLAAGLFLAAVINGFDTQPALDAARLAVPVAAICGLVLLALGQVEQTRRSALRRGGRAPERKSWLLFAVGFAVVLVLLASLGSAVLGGDAGNGLLTVLGFVFGLVLTLFSYLVLALALVFYVLLYPVIWLLNKAINKQEDQKTPPQQIADGGLREIIQSNGDSMPDWVRITLIVVAIIIVVAIVVLILFTALRRFRPATVSDDGEEERESLWSRDLAAAQLRNLFRRNRHGAGVERIDLRATPPTVRDAYRALQALAARDGVPRKPFETPAEFARRLSRVWPAEAQEIADLTSRYERVRYAGGIDEADRADAQQSWGSIWEKRSSPTNP
jgi:uncharacterized membrane protein